MEKYCYMVKYIMENKIMCIYIRTTFQIDTKESIIKIRDFIEKITGHPIFILSWVLKNANLIDEWNTSNGIFTKWSI